jgi:hypothetical protein
MKYQDVIIPDKATMYWDVYGNPLDIAMDRLLFNPDNGLRWTGWNTDFIRRDIYRSCKCVRADIANGRHAPWGEI